MGSRRFDLRRAALDFAADLTGVLNATICDGIRLNVVDRSAEGVAWVGYDIKKFRLQTERAFLIGSPSVGLHLGLSYRLQADDDRKYLSVVSSFNGLFLDAAMNKELLHIDYERDKADGYPEAHLQVDASSAHWTALLSASPEAASTLKKLHLPVGGRRFRPTLEDLIEFVVVEGLVSPRSGWNAALEEARDEFRVKQLRAMIRRNLEVAKAAVEEFSDHP